MKIDDALIYVNAAVAGVMFNDIEVAVLYALLMIPVTKLLLYNFTDPS